MTFRSEKDPLFIGAISIASIVLITVCLLALGMDSNRTPIDVVIVLGLCIVIVILLLWSTFGIKYTFTEHHLVVRSGIFGSRIPYQHIKEVNTPHNIFIGYRVLASSDAIQLLYRPSLFGHVKISPERKEMFISEIQNRCPHVKINV